MFDPIKTGIYIRVSDDHNGESFSIQAQLDKLQSYVEIKGWELYDTYIDDSISGKNIEDRPAINRLIDDVKKSNVENVLVFKIDRLTRNVKDLIDLIELFNSKDCAFNSLTESIDTTTPTGRMFIKIIGIFAELERESIIERVTVALERKVREGYPLIYGEVVPYGYSREIGYREITINEEEAKIVKEIFSMYLSRNMSFHAIAGELNIRGVMRRSIRGNGKWFPPSIQYILTNPIYAGRVRYRIGDEKKYFEAPGKHQGIVSEEIFQNVQDKMTKMLKTYKKRPKEDNYYCGTLFCVACGARMSTHGLYKNINGEEVLYNSYICPNKHDGCKTGSISHRKVEAAFREYIEGFEDFTVEANFNPETFQPVEDLSALKNEYEGYIAKLLKKEQEIMKLYINEKINFDEYNSMLEIIRVEKKAFSSKIVELESTEISDADIFREDVITNLRENWDYLMNAEKMQFLQTYVEAIFIGREPDPKQVKIKRLEFYK